MQSGSASTTIQADTQQELKGLFEQFVRNPLDAVVCDRIGAIYIKLKKYRYAQAYLEKALQINSSLRSAADRLSIISTFQETSSKKQFETGRDKQVNDLHSYASPQTVLFIGDFLYPPVGGAEKSALTLLQQLISDGHRCFAVCKGTGNEVTYNGIHVRHVSHPGLIEQSIFQIKPSLILTQLNWAYNGIALAKKHHIPSILFVRSFECFCLSPVELGRCNRDCVHCRLFHYNEMIRERFKVAFSGADKIVCNSEFMRNLTRDIYGRDSHVVYPTIAFDEHECDRSRGGTFIIMNQPEPLNGGDIFFELARRMPDYPFMTVGRGKTIQLPNCVCYGQTDPLIFFQHTRLLLVPSILSEAFGRIVVEAMRNGIPVIASNIGGLPESIGDAGILIDDFRNVEEWEKVVRMVMADSQLYDKLSARSKERSRLFECEKQMSLLRPIINKVIELTSYSSDRRILDFYNKQYETTASFPFLMDHQRERLEGLCNMVHDGEFFLDIGCADGAHMEVLYRRNITGVGIDVSIPNITRGMKQFPHLHFMHGYAEKIPFKDDFFDVVIMGDILEHLRDPRSVIREVFRVAGNLAICVPIGGKTAEHISPYTTVDSVVDLFRELDVALQWFTPDGIPIERNQVTISNIKPWVFLRAHRSNKITIVENTIAGIIQRGSIESESIHESIRDEWDGGIISRDYQQVTRFHSTAQIIEGSNILEMACGNGDLSVVIARKGAHLHGIDIMSNGIEWAKKTAQAQGVNDRTHFEVKDATQTGFPDNFFDSVIIPELIEHIKDPHQIIQEALRVVKDGGLILISVPDGPDPNPDHIRCFFRETLRLELAQFTSEITWHRLPFRRWLIGTFRKSSNSEWADKLPMDKILTVKDTVRDAPLSDCPLPGINIIGPVGAGNEFGARVRGLIQVLLECGYPISVREIPLDGQHGSVNPFRFVSFSGEPMPYAINLFCLQPFFINRLFSGAPSWLRLNKRLNVCLPDLPTHMIPDSIIAHLNRMDVVLVTNAELESVISRNNPLLPTMHIVVPPYNHRKGYFHRVNFGVPEDSLLFVSYVDMQLSPQSQNVDFVIDAFRKLQAAHARLAFVLDATSGINHEYLHFIKNCIQGDTRIKLIEGVLGREDIQSLFVCADFGINISTLNAPSPWVLEMMGNGKTIIALDLPVNETWINGTNSLCVKVQRIETKENSFSVPVPQPQNLYDILNRCCNEPAACKNIGTEASTTVVSIGERFRNGGGAQVFEQLLKCLDEKRGKTDLSKRKNRKNHLHVLLANRSDAFTNPGGDTRVMEQLKSALEKQDVTVETGTALPDRLGNFDIVHIFNSTLSLYTDAYAARALSAGVPFVVTSLQEDFPRYHNKAVMTFNMMKEYVDLGQPDGFLDKKLGLVQQQPQGTIITSPLALSHAAAVLVSGQEEAMVIKRYFPSARIQPGPFGFSLKAIEENPDMFINEYGIEDFVLCVGRLELRKNQLMLLKALEEDDIPIVFVGGGVNYHPAYVDLCKRFKRKGSTLFLDRLDDTMLASAFAAARVHCLPSWYELPGLVTIEAAAYGCPVVQSSWGTISDYCGKFLIPCEPDDYKSIRSAVCNALSRGRNPEAAQQVREITWDRAARKILDAYQFALENGNNISEPERPAETKQSVQSILDPSKMMEEVIKLVESRKFKEAVALYEAQRPQVMNVPELTRFDELMKRVKVQKQ